ncbi:sulfur carrier protein ThiS [Thalassobacillus devorans]|uniref:Sulfur carrier protein ThiS n=1 Tax=Thalassobacillus devorans TaxID=279813 RepID=A0ABQ1NG69_9BACI|nr:sulfur carrier protein ThiS [Thalassobacillus devorans]NIK27214.1 sulfur carrier protein [Thalassobacillus devorans]GGC75898.1 sulfur carrier protein ThiS [Thalassobacillus devorans]
MNIQLNGRSIDLPDNVTTVLELLDSYDIKKKISVVEHNKEIIRRFDYEKAKLADGDKIEIVHFVGGG